MRIERSEAEALAPVVVGGAAALAAELGISEGALFVGIAAAVAAGTGIAINANRQQIESLTMPSSLPGFRDWEDLDTSEKQEWVPNYGAPLGEDASKKEYQRQQFEIFAILNGWLVDPGNGNAPEPAPEPDPETDPEGHAKWQKGRNALTLLGMGAVVGVADAVGALGENFIDSLFKGETGDNVTGGLNIPVQRNAEVAGVTVPFVNCPMPLWLTYDFKNRKEYVYEQQVWLITIEDYQDWYWGWSGNYGEGIDGPSITFNLVDGKWSGTVQKSHTITKWRNLSLTTIATKGTYNGAKNIVLNGSDGVYLNLMYGNSYIFGDVASCVDGVWQGDYELVTDYGQMEETPSWVENNIFNYPALNDAARQNQQTDDNKMLGVVLPEIGTGPDGAYEYNDIVKPYPESQVNPVPDDQPVNPEDVPQPGPDDPTDDWDFERELGNAMESLGSDGLGAIFPFCLVVDMRNLSDKLATAAGYGQTRGGVLMAQDDGNSHSSEIVLPLSQFGLDGIEDLTFDFRDLFTVALMIRPWWTVLLVFSLLSESVRYFLK